MEEIHSDDGSNAEFEEGLQSEGDYESGDEEYDEDDGDLIIPEGDDDDFDSEDDDASNMQQAREYMRQLQQAQRAQQAAGQNQPSTSNARSQSEEQNGNGMRPWKGLTTLPDATRNKYVNLLQRLRSLDKKELTILLLGKHFAGKSRTVNSLLNEDSARVQYLNRDNTPTTTHIREAHGLVLNIIDAGSPTDLDSFSVRRMKEIASQLENKRIDVVLYVDRFDLYRTDGSDQQIIEGFTKFLGASIWDSCIICLTRASQTTNGVTYDDFAAKRSSKIRDTIRKHSGNQSAALPCALIENDNDCKQNKDKEKILPNNKAWLPELMSRIVEVAEVGKPYRYNAKTAERDSNPNKKLRWAIPVIFIAQLAIKKFVLDPMLQDDYNTGDKNGPFEPNVVKGRRAIAELEKDGKVRKGSARAQSSRARRMDLYDSDSD